MTNIIFIHNYHKVYIHKPAQTPNGIAKSFEEKNIRTNINGLVSK